MSATDPIRMHEDIELFVEAVNFTAADTGFSARLIEKDYFCTVLLGHLAASGETWVFKGGTCLSKVHAGFYRMSEDLDFTISMPTDALRKERSRAAAGIKKAVAGLPGRLACFSILEPITGANNSTQYAGTICYTSQLGGGQEKIKIEFGLREPLVTKVAHLEAGTLLVNPLTGAPMVKPFKVRCLSKQEAFAEKFRAALTRRDVAIRDFFDLDYAFRKLNLKPHDQQLGELIKKKLAIPGNDPMDISPGRLDALRGQLETQLKPVLRDRDYREFDLDRAFKQVSDVARRLK